jgi:phage terminase large subunit GpA-like protein
VTCKPIKNAKNRAFWENLMLLLRLNAQHPGPGFVHFPRLPDDNPTKGFDSEFFRALTSETQKSKFVNGMRKVYWEKNSYDHNESWDCMVYARAALTHSENQALRLDEIDRPRFTEEPAKKPHFGVFDPNKNPTPQSISPTRTAQTQEDKKLPRWRTNGSRAAAAKDPHDPRNWQLLDNSTRSRFPSTL